MSLVVDASAIADFLVDSERGPWVAEAIADHDLFAPELLVVEVVSVLRGWGRSGQLPAGRGAAAIDDLIDLGIELWPLLPLAPRAWAWRENVSAYDAMYVALPEELEIPLVSTDQRLRRAAQALGVPVIEPNRA